MSDENTENLEAAETDGSVEAEQINSEEKETIYEPVHLKTKSVPAFVMLLGGLIITVSVYLQALPFQKALVYIFVGLVAFLVIGEIIKIILDRIELPNPEAADTDGNVIQKGKNGEEEGGNSDGTVSRINANDGGQDQ